MVFVNTNLLVGLDGAREGVSVLPSTLAPSSTSRLSSSFLGVTRVFATLGFSGAGEALPAALSAAVPTLPVAVGAVFEATAPADPRLARPGPCPRAGFFAAVVAVPGLSFPTVLVPALEALPEAILGPFPTPTPAAARELCRLLVPFAPNKPGLLLSPSLSEVTDEVSERYDDCFLVPASVVGRVGGLLILLVLNVEARDVVLARGGGLAAVLDEVEGLAVFEAAVVEGVVLEAAAAAVLDDANRGATGVFRSSGREDMAKSDESL